VLSLLISCETISYYGQAAQGQLSLLLAREEIQTLLDDDTLAQETRRKLALILEARQFAKESLLLEPGSSYLSYVELDRPFVVWNVFAAPEFSTRAQTWCYPIAGCVSYRGYFSERRAREFAASLEREQLDVYSGGVDAYSTLGWFDDPLTSAVLHRSDHALVALLFHELAHRLVYLPGDTTFNESFATFIEQEGLRRWLQGHPQPGLMAQLEREEQIDKAFIALVSRYRDELDTLYAQSLDEDVMRTEKAFVQEALREEYRGFRQEWDYRGYDRWFAGPLNNAQLGTVASYNDLVPGFAGLLRQSQGDLARFYAEVTALSKLTIEQRTALLSEAGL
tara:strand:+ start:85 stop:1095 length:1011 start_codon:yes stop_codon:yes gene_type:complete